MLTFNCKISTGLRHPQVIDSLAGVGSSILCVEDVDLESCLPVLEGGVVALVFRHGLAILQPGRLKYSKLQAR